MESIRLTTIDDPGQRNYATNMWYGRAPYPASEAQAIATLGAGLNIEITNTVFRSLEDACGILSTHRKDLFIQLNFPFIGEDLVMPVHFGLMPTETRMGDELSMGQAIVVFWQPQSSPDQFINTLNAIFDQANILLRQENVKLINNPTR